jgi:hypothetical protein
VKALILAVFLAGCAGAEHAAAALYTAERTRCVQENDAAAPARECMKRVDARYGQDGGLHD